MKDLMNTRSGGISRRSVLRRSAASVLGGIGAIALGKNQQNAQAAGCGCSHTTTSCEIVSGPCGPNSVRQTGYINYYTVTYYINEYGSCIAAACTVTPTGRYYAPSVCPVGCYP